MFWSKSKKSKSQELQNQDTAGTSETPLNYDTEVELIFPKALFTDEVTGALITATGMSLEAKGNKLILFTDARTVAALNADPAIKRVIVGSGMGAVLYGWRPKERTAFLMEKLRSIALEHEVGSDAAKRAVFGLHLFVLNGFKDEISPNPFAAELPPVGASDKFDPAAAIEAMLSPGQMNKPKTWMTH